MSQDSKEISIKSTKSIVEETASNEVKSAKSSVEDTASNEVKSAKSSVEGTASKEELQLKSELSKDEIKDKKPSKKTTEGRKLAKMSSRARRNMERMEMLSRPTARRLRSLWEEKCAFLPAERKDKIKSALEEDYFLSPEQTEQYFQALGPGPWTGPNPNANDRKEAAERNKELRQRQKWLVNFSAQVAYRLCDYIAKGNKELLVSNRLRSIADVVLERVAEILGEPKPSRNHPGRLARFMVAISDRIAVWLENAVYRADAYEPSERGSHDHMRLDNDKPLVC